MEHWVEVNLFGRLRDQDTILLDHLLPHVEELRRKRELVTFHFFREPEIRFRERLSTDHVASREKEEVAKIARGLVSKGLATRWHFGSHGTRGVPYKGEEDRYGKEGWKVAQRYFRDGSVTALALLELRRKGALENPLWGRGLGNPWEGGPGNPWRRKREDPLEFHWSRYVHLFSNQLGFGIDEEVTLCRRQARNYGRVSEELGMKW
jgi:Lantibiotic biosynthesis dehydratase C-term